MITVLPGLDKAAELTDRTIAGGRVRLRGGVYECPETVFFGPGTRLVIDPADPPILKRTGTCDRVVVPYGDDIDLSRLVVDLNLGGPYVPYRTAIAFDPPDNTRKARPIRRLKADGVRFITSEPLSGHNGRDCFGWSLTNMSGEVLEDIAITNGFCDVDDIQLTANGSSAGFRRLRVNDNAARGGRNAGIGITALNGLAHGPCVLEDVQVLRNVLTNCHGLGILIGQDGSGADRLIRGKARVEQNYIEMAADGGAYQHALYFRDGPAAGDFGLEIDAVGNVLDFRRVPATANAPRTVVFDGDNPASRLSVRRNRALTDRELESGVSLAIRLTQSLNRYVPSGREWRV